MVRECAPRLEKLTKGNLANARPSRRALFWMSFTCARDSKGVPALGPLLCVESPMSAVYLLGPSKGEGGVGDT
jgi:hypothetical protein